MGYGYHSNCFKLENRVGVPFQLFNLRKRNMGTIQTFSLEIIEYGNQNQLFYVWKPIRGTSLTCSFEKKEFEYYYKFLIWENGFKLPFQNFRENTIWVPFQLCHLKRDFGYGMIPKLSFLRWERWNVTQIPFSQMKKLEWYTDSIFSDEKLKIYG